MIYTHTVYFRNKQIFATREASLDGFQIAELRTILRLKFPKGEGFKVSEFATLSTESITEL